MKHWPLVASFLLFIALCASVAYWAMQMFTPPVRPAAAPPAPAYTAPNLNAAATLFGGRASTAVASNFLLKGVIVSGSQSGSVAILSADGKPAQAVRVNSEVMPGVTVKEVHRQYVLLSDGGVIKRVELPEEAKADRNTAVATRAPTSGRPAPPGAPAAGASSAAPPRVVVNQPPQQTPSAAASGTGVSQPSPSGTPSNIPQQATPQQATPQQATTPNTPGMPANTGAPPAMDMGGSSIGYNPAGAQSSGLAPQATPSPAASSMQGTTPGQSIASPQTVPQSQQVLPPRSVPGAPSVPQPQQPR